MAGTAPLRAEFNRSIKARAVEEPIDLWFYRPLGYALVRLLEHTRVTPNMVSAASVAAAAVACWFFVEPTVRGAALGAFFLLLSGVLDSSDGQLARMTGRVSYLGRVIDGLCDAGAFFFVYLSVAASLSARLGWNLGLVVVLGLVTGTWQSLQTALPDYTRALLLDLGYGEHHLPGEEPPEVKRRLEESRAKGAGWFSLFLLHFLWGYTRRQRRILASSRRLKQKYDDAVARRPEIREEFQRLYRQANEPLFGWWSLLSLNSYHIAMIAAAFAGALASPGFIRNAGTGLFYIYVWLLTVPMVTLVVWQRRVDLRLLAELDRLQRGEGAPLPAEAIPASR